MDVFSSGFTSVLPAQLDAPGGTLLALPADTVGLLSLLCQGCSLQTHLCAIPWCLAARSLLLGFFLPVIIIFTIPFCTLQPKPRVVESFTVLGGNIGSF